MFNLNEFEQNFVHLIPNKFMKRLPSYVNDLNDRKSIINTTYTVFRKKHSLAFSFISPWKMFRFEQNFQGMFKRNHVFHWLKN